MISKTVLQPHRQCPVCKKQGTPGGMLTLFGVRARWHPKCFKKAQDAGTIDGKPRTEFLTIEVPNKLPIGTEVMDSVGDVGMVASIRKDKRPFPVYGIKYRTGPMKGRTAVRTAFEVGRR